MSTVLISCSTTKNKKRLPESAPVTAVLTIVAGITSLFKSEDWIWVGLLCWAAKTKYFHEKRLRIKKNKNANHISNLSRYPLQKLTQKWIKACLWSWSAKAEVAKTLLAEDGIRDCLATVGPGTIYVTGSSQCCCTAVHSQKRGAWKNVQGFWRDGLNRSAGWMRPAAVVGGARRNFLRGGAETLRKIFCSH